MQLINEAIEFFETLGIDPHELSVNIRSEVYGLVFKEVAHRKMCDIFEVFEKQAQVFFESISPKSIIEKITDEAGVKGTDDWVWFSKCEEYMTDRAPRQNLLIENLKSSVDALRVFIEDGIDVFPAKMEKKIEPREVDRGAVESTAEKLGFSIKQAEELFKEVGSDPLRERLRANPRQFGKMIGFHKKEKHADFAAYYIYETLKARRIKPALKSGAKIWHYLGYTGNTGDIGEQTEKNFRDSAKRFRDGPLFDLLS